MQLSNFLSIDYYFYFQFAIVTFAALFSPTRSCIVFQAEQNDMQVLYSVSLLADAH